MDGFGGQQVIVDFDTGRIIVVHSLDRHYNWKKIVLKKNSIVYVLAPANTFTGGPELLHQFAHHFFKLFKVKTKHSWMLLWIYTITY